VPSALISTKRLHAALLARRDEVARALLHHAAELLLAALPDRDEVHDHLAAVDRAAQALASVMSPWHELGAPGRERRRRASARIADERRTGRSRSRSA
jgi:hypothetical protein